MKTTELFKIRRNVRLVAMALWLHFPAQYVSAQTIQSADLTALVNQLTAAVETAQINQTTGFSNAANFEKGADVFQNQARDESVSYRNRLSAAVMARQLEIEEWKSQAESLRRNNQLLLSALESATKLRGEMPLAKADRDESLDASLSQQTQIDRAMTNFAFQTGTRIDLCCAEALRSARNFYVHVCQSDDKLRESGATLDSLTHRLADWAVLNQQSLIQNETKLRNAQLAKASVLAQLGHFDSQGITAKIVTARNPGEIPNQVGLENYTIMPPTIPFPSAGVYSTAPASVRVYVPQVVYPSGIVYVQRPQIYLITSWPAPLPIVRTFTPYYIRASRVNRFRR